MRVVDIPVDSLDFSPADRAAIDATVQDMLSSPHFRKSKRYPALLEYSVLHTLSGEFDLLKERIIGCKVFGRPADYDTNADPVVRTAAGEVRKRIAQYFYEHPDSAVRIALPLGSYICEFQFQEQAHSELIMLASGETEPASRSMYARAGQMHGMGASVAVSIADTHPHISRRPAPIEFPAPSRLNGF